MKIMQNIDFFHAYPVSPDSLILRDSYLLHVFVKDPVARIIQVVVVGTSGDMHLSTHSHVAKVIG